MSEGTSNPKITPSDTLIVAVAPLLGYTYTYYFEKGFLSFFGAPTNLISLSLAQVLPASIVTLVAMVVPLSLVLAVLASLPTPAVVLAKRSAFFVLVLGVYVLVVALNDQWDLLFGILWGLVGLTVLWCFYEAFHPARTTSPGGR